MEHPYLGLCAINLLVATLSYHTALESHLGALLPNAQSTWKIGLILAKPIKGKSVLPNVQKQMVGILAEDTICNRDINHTEMMEVIPRADLQEADVLQQVGPRGWAVQGAFVISCGQQQPLLSHFAFSVSTALQISTPVLFTACWFVYEVYEICPNPSSWIRRKKLLLSKLTSARNVCWLLCFRSQLVAVCWCLQGCGMTDSAERYSLPEVDWPVSIHFHGGICLFFPLECCQILQYEGNTAIYF